MGNPAPLSFRTSPRAVVMLLFLAVVAGCHVSDRSAFSDDDVVARAVGRTLTVREASQLMAQNRRVAADPQAVGVLAGLWVEYTLLDSALRADSTLRSVNLDVITAPERDQAIIMKLRDRVIKVDTLFTDEQVRKEAEARGIRLESDRKEAADRKEPGDGEEGEGEAVRELRRALAASAQQRAEAAYLDSIVAAGSIEPTDSAFDLMHAVAANPNRAMDKRAAAEPIARYRDGAFTAGDFALYLRGQSLELQRTLAGAPREQMNEELRRLITNQLLLREASRRGVTLSAAEEVAIRDRTRQEVESTLARVRDLSRGADSTTARRDLATMLTAAISGRGPLVPLGPLGAALRGAYASEVVSEAFSAVARRVKELRVSALPAAVPSDSAAGASRRDTSAAR